MGMMSKIFKGIVLPLVLLAVVGLCYFLYYNTFFGMNLIRKVQSRAEDVVHSAYFMCQVTDRVLQKRADSIVQHIESALSMLGSPSLAPGQQNWQARSVLEKTPRTITLPPLLLSDASGDKRDIATLVNAITRRVDGDVAIYQRINDRCDQIKIFCTVEGICTPEKSTELLLVHRPGGQPDCCLRTLEKGEVVFRPEYAQGRLLLSVTYPLIEKQQLIGMIVVRAADPDLDRLRADLMQLRLGETGYVYAIKASGFHQGAYFISQNGERDGEDIWDCTDAAGRPFIQSIITQALNIHPRKQRVSVPVVFERYPWKNPGDRHARYKMSAITYFEPWDWVIGAGYYEDDLL